MSRPTPADAGAVGEHSPTASLPSPAARSSSFLGEGSVLKPDVAAMLTPQQREVLEWVCQGKSNWEIGVILRRSEATVKKHLQRIYWRLRVPNRIGAVLLALRGW